MFHRPTASPASRPNRRPTRFKAGVEVLDARRLMAGGVTGTTLSVHGLTGAPVTSFDPTNPAGPPATGNPIPLVILTGGGGESASVDWGDGSRVDVGSFTTRPDGAIDIDGPDHTYSFPGTYSITVLVFEGDNTLPLIFTDQAIISASPLSITGQLNPASDSGYSDGDGITAINTPNFFGTTQPGASVVLTAMDQANVAGGFVTIGTGVADASGHWSITSTPLIDGVFSIYVTAAGQFGATTGTYIEPAPLYNGLSLSVDTAGPTIAAFRVTDARKGTFQVAFVDPYGLLIAPFVDPANYTVGRPSPTPRKGQKFPVANLASSTFSLPISPATTNNPLLVTGTLGTGKAIIPRNGVYTFTIHAPGVASLSGAYLDGEFAGKFPTGNGQAGGDFQVKVTVRNGKAAAPVAVTPVVKAKFSAAKHHA